MLRQLKKQKAQDKKQEAGQMAAEAVRMRGPLGLNTARPINQPSAPSEPTSMILHQQDIPLYMNC